jgi:hypothetical protein
MGADGVRDRAALGEGLSQPTVSSVAANSCAKNDRGVPTQRERLKPAVEPIVGEALRVRLDAQTFRRRDRTANALFHLLAKAGETDDQPRRRVVSHEGSRRIAARAANR